MSVDYVTASANQRAACDALGGRMCGKVARVPSPGKGPQNRSMTILVNEQVSYGIVLHDHSNPDDMGTMLAIKDDLAERGIITGDGPRRRWDGASIDWQAEAEKQKRRDAELELRRKRATEKALRIWSETEPLEGTLAESFLRMTRGLHTRPWHGLSAHPALDFWEDTGELDERERPIFRKVFTSPAMVGLVSHVATGRPLGVHLTYLDERGRKHPLAGDAARKMRGVTKMGCVRLNLVTGKTHAVAEGIESALAYTDATGTPCDASLSAGAMEDWLPPRGVTHVEIAHDQDRNGRGLDAAKILEDRLTRRGISSTLCPPPVELGDWNDFTMGTALARSTTATRKEASC